MSLVDLTLAARFMAAYEARVLFDMLARGAGSGISKQHFAAFEI